MARRHLAKGSVLSEHTRELTPLLIGDVVQVQNQTGHSAKKWDKSGSVVKVLPFNQYRVKVDGSGRVTLRAQQFLWQIFLYVVEKSPRAEPGLMRNQSAGYKKYELEVSCSEESKKVTEAPVLRRSERVAVRQVEVTPTRGGS